MQITTDTVALIDYTLTNDRSETIDSSEGRQPLAYLHGQGQIIPGLEKALEGKTAGESFQVSISPEEGYGVRNESLIAEVPRANIQGPGELSVGMQLHTRGAGGPGVVTVTKIENDTVTVDANHPLAGQTLHFAITIREVRAATADEIAHGHVHGPGGHHH